MNRRQPLIHTNRGRSQKAGLIGIGVVLLLLGSGVFWVGAGRAIGAATPPRAQRATAVPGLILVRPQDTDCAVRTATFVWRWSGPRLDAGSAFEVRLWRVGDRSHPAVSSATSGNSLRVDLTRLDAVKRSGTGPYLWTVAVVQVTPYRQIGREAAPRRLYIDLRNPSASSCVSPWSPTNTPGAPLVISVTSTATPTPIAGVPPPPSVTETPTATPTPVVGRPPPPPPPPTPEMTTTP